MRAGLVSFTFAGAISAAAIPGAANGASCFSINGFAGKTFGSFHYHEASGTVTNERGSICGWGHEGRKLVCGSKVKASAPWSVQEGRYISWAGHTEGYYACYRHAVYEAEIYLERQPEKTCKKVYAEKSACHQPSTNPCHHPNPHPHCGLDFGHHGAPNDHHGQPGAPDGHNGQSGTPHDQHGQSGAPNNQHGQSGAPNGQHGQSGAPNEQHGYTSPCHRPNPHSNCGFDLEHGYPNFQNGHPHVPRAADDDPRSETEGKITSETKESAIDKATKTRPATVKTSASTERPTSTRSTTKETLSSAERPTSTRSTTRKTSSTERGEVTRTVTKTTGSPSKKLASSPECIPLQYCKQPCINPCFTPSSTEWGEVTRTVTKTTGSSSQKPTSTRSTTRKTSSTERGEVTRTVTKTTGSPSVKPSQPCINPCPAPEPPKPRPCVHCPPPPPPPPPPQPQPQPPPPPPPPPLPPKPQPPKPQPPKPCVDCFPPRIPEEHRPCPSGRCEGEASSSRYEGKYVSVGF